MKQIISMLLSLVMVMSAVCVSAEVLPPLSGGGGYTAPAPDDEGYNATPIFEEDFSSQTIKFSSPSKATNVVDSGYTTLTLAEDATGYGYIQTADSSIPSSNYIKLEMDIKLDEASNRIQIAPYCSERSVRFPVIDFGGATDDPNIGSIGNATYVIGQWNTLEMYIDNTRNWATTYVNGNLAADAAMPNSQAGDIVSHFRICILHDKTGAKSVAIDNVKIYANSVKYNPVYKDDFSKYSSTVGLNGSLANYSGFGNTIYNYKTTRRHLVKNPKDNEDYVMEYTGFSDGTKSMGYLYMRKSIVTTSDSKFEDRDNVYLSIKLYPKANIKRNIRFFYTDKEGETQGFPIIMFDNTTVGKIDIRYGTNQWKTNAASYNVNDWNTLNLRMTKLDDSNYSYCLTLNGVELPTQKMNVLTNFTHFGIADDEKNNVDITYIDDIEVGTWVDHDKEILKQGSDSAIVFTSYTESAGEDSVTAIVAAYDVEGGKKTLVAIETLEDIALTPDTASEIRCRIKSGNADEYKVFFVNNVGELTPLSQSKTIN